jgi:hypothetical protein
MIGVYLTCLLFEMPRTASLARTNSVGFALAIPGGFVWR